MTCKFNFDFKLSLIYERWTPLSDFYWDESWINQEIFAEWHDELENEWLDGSWDDCFIVSYKGVLTWWHSTHFLQQHCEKHTDEDLQKT